MADSGESPWRWSRVAVSLLIGIGFIVFVEWFVGWATLLRPWREVPPAWIVAAAGLVLLTHVARALRVHDYFGAPVRGRRRACLRLVLRHNLANNLLPLRSGELAFPVLMARDFGVRPAESLLGLLWFRALDVHAVLLFALPALMAGAGGGATAVVALAWLVLPWLGFRLGHGLTRHLRGRVAGRAGRLLERLLLALPQAAAVFWRAQLWTLAAWGLKLAVFAWVLMLFAPLDAAVALLGAIGGELTSVLPVHGVAGLGTYEAGVVAGLAASGLDAATLLRAAVNLHLFVLGVTLVTGGIAAAAVRRRGSLEEPTTDDGSA